MAKRRRFTLSLKQSLFSKSSAVAVPSRSVPTTQSQRKSTLTVEATPP